jgi:nicotinamide-nucleotide amidase
MNPSDDELRALAGRVGERTLARGQVLVTAESCTAGWIAKLCTDHPGSSAWYRGGAVVYDDALKVALLGVRPATLAEHGAVSESTAREMATGALAWLGGSLSVAVTGIAGPAGGTTVKPVGTVWLAWAMPGARGDSVRVLHRRYEGDRDAVRRQAVADALAGLLKDDAELPHD